MILEAAILIVCIVVHEFGHYITARILKASPIFYFKNLCLMIHSEPKTASDGMLITVSGILAGFAMLFIFSTYLTQSSFFILLILLIVGSRIDFNNIYQAYSRNNVNES